MRNDLLVAGLIGAALVRAPAVAQAVPAPTDQARAALAAEQAARAAEAAAAAARDAAAAATLAAEAARRSAPEPAGPPPADENLPVGPDGMLPDDRAAEVFETAIEAGVANGPNYRSLKASGSPDFQLIASDDEKVASLAWTLDLHAPSRAGRLNSTMMTLTASHDLDSDGPTEFADLGGLTGGTEVKLSFVHYSSAFTPDQMNLAHVEEAERRCRIREAGAPDLATLCAAAEYQQGGVSAFVAKYNPGSLRPFLDSVVPGPVTFFGVEAAINQADFSYLDQPAFEVRDASKFGFGGTLFAGVLFDVSATSLTGSFTYARSYRAARQITLCQPINAIPQSQCITAAGGPPKREEQAVIALEMRHAFPAPVGEFAKLAIAPELSFDVKNSAYAVDLPIYFVANGTGKLRGGLRLGYVNTKGEDGGREDDFSLGLFVGVPFSLFQ
jgi:hypothetical protein